MVLADGIYDKSIFTFRLHRLESGEEGREGGERPRAPFKAEERPITGLEKPSRLWSSNHATFVASREPSPLLSGAQRTGTTAQSREGRKATVGGERRKD